MFRFGDIFWIEQNWTILGRMIKTLFHILRSRIKTLKSGTNFYLTAYRARAHTLRRVSVVVPNDGFLLAVTTANKCRLSGVDKQTEIEVEDFFHSLHGD